MAYISDVLREEHERLVSKKDFYQNQLAQLQHGSIQKKSINGKIYHYLCYREKNKVVSKYIPVGEIDRVKDEIVRYKQAKAALKNIKDNLKTIGKVL